MAQTLLSIRFETDLVDDCIRDLVRVHMALATRHGARFRELERRVEALEDGPAPDMEMKRLDPGRFIMVPPPSWTGLIAEARSMGVI